MHGGEIVAATLAAHGVTHVFTLCGGHISPILTGARARGIAVVDVRDEATAVFAADAWGRLTGVPGVAAVTAGPGVTNALTAVQNARLAETPLVLLAGAAPTVLRGRGALQDIDQAAVLRPHVKRFFAARRVRELGRACEQAFFESRSGVPGPVCVECPVDLLYPEDVVRSWYGSASGSGKSLGARLVAGYLARHLDRIFAGAAGVAPPAMHPPRIEPPGSASVTRTATALRLAQRPVLLVGSQALAVPAEAARIAAAVGALGVPVFLSGMARGLLGRDHPLQHRHARRQALREADLVILAGVTCDFRLDYGRHIGRGAALVAVNRSGAATRRNRRPTIAAAGDPGAFLVALAAAPGATDGPARWETWRGTLHERDAARDAEIDAGASTPGSRVPPLALARALERVIGDDAVMVADGGDFVATLSYVLRPRGPLSWLDPGVFGTLGVGAGFALAAKLARPAAECWLLLGDGASGFGLAEFDTLVRHRVPVIAVVGNDGGWTQIAREQVKLLGDDVATVLARSRYHDVAAAFGAEGLLLDDAREIDSTLARARTIARDGRPVLVNAILDRSAFREGSISM